MATVGPCWKCGNAFPKEDYGGTVSGARDAKAEHVRGCTDYRCNWCNEPMADDAELLEHAKNEHEDVLPDCIDVE